VIQKRTVLVLGAGASKQYGYPAGTELPQRMLGYLGDLSSGLPFSSQGPLRQALHLSDFNADEINRLGQALAQPGYETIDQLLEYRNDLVKSEKRRSLGP
jgi:hypothetical protein